MIKFELPDDVLTRFNGLLDHNKRGRGIRQALRRTDEVAKRLAIDIEKTESDRKSPLESSIH